MHVEGALPLPVTRESAQGSLILFWESERAILEIEVATDGTFEWFAKNKATGAYEGSDDEHLVRPTERVIESLRTTFSV